MRPLLGVAALVLAAIPPVRNLVCGFSLLTPSLPTPLLGGVARAGLLDVLFVLDLLTAVGAPLVVAAVVVLVRLPR